MDAPTPSQDPGPAPQAAHTAMNDAQARQWALFTHLSALVGLLSIPSLLGPLVMWLVKKDAHPFVDDQGKEALNFHITMLIAFIVAGAIWFIGGILTLGIGLVVLWILPVGVAIFALVMSVVAALKANEGVAYRYPMSIRMVK